MARNTLQQHIIYNTVMEMGSHPSPDDVYEVVHENYPSISRATVYRVLNKLADAGELKKVNMPSGADRFDYRNDEHMHIHCTVCNKVFDLDFDGAAEILSRLNDMVQEKAVNRNDFLIRNLNVTFEGICPECQREKEANNERIKRNENRG